MNTIENRLLNLERMATENKPSPRVSLYAMPSVDSPDYEDIQAKIAADEKAGLLVIVLVPLLGKSEHQ
jgi:hypothetical protein